MSNHSKTTRTRKDNPATKPPNPQPKSTEEAQNNEPNAGKGNAHHASSKDQPTSNNGPTTTSTETQRRSRGRPKRAVVQQSDSMGQEPAQTKAVVPHKRGRKAATLADDDHGSQPPPKRTRNLKGKAKK